MCQLIKADMFRVALSGTDIGVTVWARRRHEYERRQCQQHAACLAPRSTTCISRDTLLLRTDWLTIIARVFLDVWEF